MKMSRLTDKEAWREGGKGGQVWSMQGQENKMVKVLLVGRKAGKQEGERPSVVDAGAESEG
jgi:hypothetical protein